MALLGQTQAEYYQGNNYGSYQFTSLEDIINYFMITHVGEGKIIPKISRSVVAFHAQRAIQELSFDTFKSVKSQEIVLPPSLTMILPQDYVNYVKLTESDSSGIEHILYPTSKTSNPFTIKQNSDGSYKFSSDENLVLNGEFDSTLSSGWSSSVPVNVTAWDSVTQNAGGTRNYFSRLTDELRIVNEELSFEHLWSDSFGGTSSRAYGVWQKIDVSKLDYIDLSANGNTSDQQLDASSTVLAEPGLLRVGLTSTNPDIGWSYLGNDGITRITPATLVNPRHFHTKSPNASDRTEVFDIGYLEWNVNASDSTLGEAGIKELLNIDVTSHNDIWVYITSSVPWQAAASTTVTQGSHGGLISAGALQPTTSANSNGSNHIYQKNLVDQVSVKSSLTPNVLLPSSRDGNSNTWNNYKSATPSENRNDDYEDEVYWPYEGERYGLDPQHAQINGSFYIDDMRGVINFSSILNGKTIILEYISDGLGTEEEMRVHKFAEEAMYKSIAHAVVSTSSHAQQLAPRFKKEKFAAVRQAKLRLSNIKLEEITQILRGKSKQIKH